MQPDSLEFLIDFNLPPKMAAWLKDGFNVSAKSFQELGFDTTPDVEVYKIAAKKLNIIVITTKDVDFIDYQKITGGPPKVLYISVGNISNENLKKLIQHKFAEILQLFLQPDTSFIEISTT